MGEIIYPQSIDNKKKYVYDPIELSDTLLKQPKETTAEKACGISYYYKNEDKKSYRIVMDYDNGVSAWDSDGKNESIVDVTKRFSLTSKRGMYVPTYNYEPVNDLVVNFQKIKEHINSIKVIESKDLSNTSLNNLNILASLEGHTEFIDKIYNLPDGKIISSSRDQTFRVWDLKNFKCVSVLSGFTSFTKYIIIMSDDRIMSVSSNNIYDSEIRIWDIIKGKCLMILIIQRHHMYNITAKQLVCDLKNKEKYMIVISSNNYEQSYDKHIQYDEVRSIKIWNVEIDQNLNNPVSINNKPDYLKIILPDMNKENIFAHYYHNLITSIGILSDGRILFGIANKLKMMTPILTQTLILTSTSTPTLIDYEITTISDKYNNISNIVVFPDGKFVITTKDNEGMCAILSK